MNKFVKIAVAAFAAVATLAIAACDVPAKTADQVQKAAQAQLSQNSNFIVGMPAISNFQAKKNLKHILELVDTEHYATYTYLVGMNNQLTLLCHSIGYPIPYATQFTNPQRIAQGGEVPYAGNVVLPQADPDGVFRPANSDGTWVTCLNPKTNEESTLYVEPHVLTSPFPLQ